MEEAKNQENLNNYKPMESYIGKKDDLFNNFRPVYDITSIKEALKTFLFGHSKKFYDGSIMELLGKNAVDIFKKYQVWYDQSYYIHIGGFDGVSFYFDEDYTITRISYGRILEGKEVVEKAMEIARINHFGLEVTRHGNMRGIYYGVNLIDKYVDVPYVKVKSSSTFRGGSEKIITLE